ncbi:phage holin family protein [Thermoactinomyces sp. DSM 45892]|uniref:phage holin family protein n=1 Tax=Thermoactinomyces sp. DSM 45892 TaxID=1882753 RepID=UPI0008944680|nr:phage holin family protein [Thermoactinomyces sp. DSM 45892]SDZ20132.1 putative membrane protein [Thermoactinomyces sp. DSM 45892]
MTWIFRLLLNAVVIFLIAHFVPGISVGGAGTALAVALVLGLVNLFIRPIISFLSLPIQILTLGLFTLLINVGMLYLTAFIVDGFEIQNFISAIIASLIISVTSWIIGLILD